MTMTKTIGSLVAVGALVALPLVSRPDDPYEGATDESAAVVAAAETVTPTTPPPAGQPPAPPATQPAPPTAASPPATAAPSGQWVYTNQYGWVWMPYGDQYSYIPSNSYGEPYAYVYYPVYGWCWISAPWIWGIGPWPYFAYGPGYYPWYVGGYWRYPWRYHYVPGFRGAPPRAAAAGFARSGGFGVRSFGRATAAPGGRGGFVAPGRGWGGGGAHMIGGGGRVAGAGGHGFGGGGGGRAFGGGHFGRGR